VQAAHAAIKFQHDHPEIAKEWNNVSQYLVFLTVENEKELYRLLDKIKFYDLKFTAFYEPDIDNQLTAIAIEPCERTKKICSNLPLLLK
jgi:peptidyl-tRNA hydrolase